MTEPTGLYERLAKARAEFQDKANFKKTKTEGLVYAYLPVETAKPLIEQCTAKNGITILPVGMEILQDMTSREEKTNRYGQTSSWLYITAKVTFRLACPEGSEELEIMAEAQDNSDKCINKVYTMAYKNLIKIVFGFSESAKDDSKFTDAREQDNDFNQEPVINHTKPEETIRVPRKQVALNDPLFGKKGAGQ